MKKKIFKKLMFMILSIMVLSFTLTACKSGDEQSTIEEGSVKFEILMNDGSIFIYTIQDPQTGVWYMCTSRGVTPRLNTDGSLYITED